MLFNIRKQSCSFSKAYHEKDCYKSSGEERTSRTLSEKDKLLHWQCYQTLTSINHNILISLDGSPVSNGPPLNFCNIMSRMQLISLQQREVKGGYCAKCVIIYPIMDIKHAFSGRQINAMILELKDWY